MDNLSRLIFVLLFGFSASLCADINLNEDISDEGLILRWRQQKYTLESFNAFLEANAQEHEEDLQENAESENLHAKERMNSIFKEYKEGDEIWSYHNNLFEKKMGRYGFALFRKDRLIVHVTLFMN